MGTLYSKRYDFITHIRKVCPTLDYEELSTKLSSITPMAVNISRCIALDIDSGYELRVTLY